jgi:hypothetical protein
LAGLPLVRALSFDFVAFAIYYSKLIVDGILAFIQRLGMPIFPIIRFGGRLFVPGDNYPSGNEEE